MKYRLSKLIPVVLIFLLASCQGGNKPEITSGDLTLSYNNLLYSKIDFAGAEKPLMENFQPSELLRLKEGTAQDFKLTSFRTEHFKDRVGSGMRLVIQGLSAEPGLQVRKKVVASAYEGIPDLITTRVTYVNEGDQKLSLTGWENNRYVLSPLAGNDNEAPFWSFQSGTYPSRPDWVLPIKSGFSQQNYQGMNASDYGGGTPVVDVWRPDAGLAVGHTALTPQLISLPVHSGNIGDGVELGLRFDADSVSTQKIARAIPAGDSVSTLNTFVTAHTGDYFASLEKYRNILKKEGVQFNKPPSTAYDPIWCAWGYERNFTLDQVLKTLPKVKELGFKWVVLDDGWQRAEGDWRTNSKFDDMSMKEFVDRIHAYGLKAKLWWAPLAADPGSRVYEQHPEMLLVNKKGNYQDISWWDSEYMNPALQSTRQYHKELVQKFIKDWGFDGLKIDGQHLNQVPADYGHSDHQSYPEESLEKLPEFYRMIYNTARDIKKDAVVEICPCGTSASSFIMPYMNQSVASDPLSSWQIRLKGKTYKALMGSDAAYYGDHVELSDNQTDFASTVGVGGVIGTKFTWPKSNAPKSEYLLTDAKEQLVKKWMNIYEKYMLPKGTYRGELYDIGFDRPETHVVEKDGALFYAFYADRFDGSLELRGLKTNTTYALINYETGEKIGEVSGPTAELSIEFKDHLLIQAKPLE